MQKEKKKSSVNLGPSILSLGSVEYVVIHK